MNEDEKSIKAGLATNTLEDTNPMNYMDILKSGARGAATSLGANAAILERPPMSKIEEPVDTAVVNKNIADKVYDSVVNAFNSYTKNMLPMFPWENMEENINKKMKVDNYSNYVTGVTMDAPNLKESIVNAAIEEAMQEK